MNKTRSKNMMGNYTSTRNNKIKTTFSNAVLQGISENGGLFVPINLHPLSLKVLLELSYQEMAIAILKAFIDDFEEEEIANCVRKAYSHTFSTSNVVVINPLADATLLELYHGPTSAFKDVALQLLPQFMQTAKHKHQIKEDTYILTATSGDTGKAALEGFKNIEGIQVICLYPNQLVSKIQEKQMLTTQGKNTQVYAVKGNFDDCQRMVKEVFNDSSFNKKCLDHNIQLSSANSINIGRLCPQVVYYFYTYCQLVKNKTIQLGDEINFVVPTGNFGNILAGYYAKKLGLPIHQLICASNKNDVLTDFIRTGTYNRNREFHKTISPSMDILVSSNVERFIYECCTQDSNRVKECMDDLTKTGSYSLLPDELELLKKEFKSYTADDKMTKQTIHSCFNKTNRIIDPHTAVALNCYKQYQDETQDKTHTVILSTASCYKFPTDVVQAILGITLSEEEAILSIKKNSSEEIPTNINALITMDDIYPNIIKQDELRDKILERMK
ncbi:MAG: threonine synthase [Anaerorhabdus sp.]